MFKNIVFKLHLALLALNGCVIFDSEITPAVVSRNSLVSLDPLYADYCKEYQNEPHELIKNIMEHPLFQRLDKIHQLSLKRYSGKSITRGAHCRGARYMTSIYVNILNENSEKGEQITPVQSLAIQVAALLHDIGHGPFSHLFENVLKIQGINWDHEEQSVIIVRHILEGMDMSGVYKLPADFTDAVCDMIIGINLKSHISKYSKSADFNRYAIFTLVNGDYESSLDVDKFDYMRRDSYSVCSPEYFNLVSETIKDIMKKSKIENDKIVYSIKAEESLVLLSHMVYMNYRYLYFNPADHGNELLFCDILKESTVMKNISETLNDLDKFEVFTDSHLMELLRIEFKDDIVKYELINRLDRNDGYEMIGYVDIEYNDSINPNVDELIADFETKLKKALNTAFDTVFDAEYVVDDEFALTAKVLNRIVKKKTGKWNILETVTFYDRHSDLSYELKRANPSYKSESMNRLSNFNPIYESANKNKLSIFNPICKADDIPAFYDKSGNCHTKYLKQDHFDVKKFLYKPKSIEEYSEYEKDILQFQPGTIQLRLYSKTKDGDKISKLMKAFSDIIEQILS